MTRCADDDALQAYIEHELAPPEHEALEEHIADCSRCRELLAHVVSATFPLQEERDEARLLEVPFANYEIGSEVARGGSGRVLRAYDTRLGRAVAVKELLHDTHSERRFVREALVTARLEHPAIVPVHEVGRWPTGQPFYSMKLVSGETLQKMIRKAQSLSARLPLLPSVIAVADAVAYAHSKGVIHRDLKPANVIVGEFGETVVVDWGLAKDLHAAESPAAVVTDAGAESIEGTVMGTPCYMPPEQARGEPVDERADVYALGAILYELLAGRAPYSGAAPRTAREVLEAVIAAPATPVDVLQDGIPRDLIAVVNKAMSRDPADRYPTASELAADLRSFQAGQLVSAREYSRWALLVRWLRRHRFSASVSAIALAVAATTAVVNVQRVVEARRAAEGARVSAEERRAEALAAREQAEARNNQLRLLQARALLGRDPTTALAWLKQIPVEAPLWTEARAIAEEAVSQGFAEHVLHAEDALMIEFSPDGKLLAFAGIDQHVGIFQFAGAQASRIDFPGTMTLSPSFSDDGAFLAASDDGSVLWWPSLPAREPGRLITRLPPGRAFAAISRDGRTVAAVSSVDPAVVVVDLPSGAKRTFEGAIGALGIAISADGRLVSTSGIDKISRIWALDGGAVLELLGMEPASQFTFSSDGTRFLVAELNGIRDWTLADRRASFLPFPKQRFIAVASSPDDRIVAAAGFEGPIFLLDRASGEVAALRGHEGMVTWLDFSDDGKRIASTARDHTMRVWRAPDRQDRILIRVAGSAYRPVFSPDGSRVVAAGTDGRVHLAEVKSGRTRVLAGHQKPVFDVQFSPDGRRIVSQSKDQTVRVWNLAAGTSRILVETAPFVDFGRVLFARNGNLACSLDRETLVVFSPEGKRLCTFQGGFNLAHDFHPRGEEIAFTSNDEVRVGELAGCTSRILYHHGSGKSAYMIAYSPDGRWVASASDDGTVGLYSFDRREGRRLRGHDTDVSSISFSPDGRTLASGSGDRTVALWDVESGAMRRLRGHQQYVVGVAFSPDGKMVASWGFDHAIRLWDVASGADVVLRGHRDRILGVSFSPDGASLVSGSHDGTVRIWPADVSRPVPVGASAIRRWLEAITTVQIGPNNVAASP